MELPYKYILLGIRGVQLLFVFLIVILEIVQAVDFASYYDDAYYKYVGQSTNSGTSEYFTGSTDGKAGTVVWVFMVMLITFLGIIAYSALFFLGHVWEQRHKIYFIGFDLIFFVLWFTEVFTNLYWAYKGSDQFCYYYNKPEFKRVDNRLDVVCGAYIASNVFGWFLLVAFALGGALSLKIHFDAKKENSGTDDNMRHVQPQSNQQQFNQQQFNQQPPSQQQLNQQQFTQSPNQQFNQQQFSQPPNQQFNQQQFSQPPNQQFNQQPPSNQQQFIERDTNHEAVLQ